MNRALTLNRNIAFAPRLPIKWQALIKLFWILSVFLIFAFLITYIYQINGATTEQYLLEKYGKQLETIAQENKKLEMNILGLSSLDDIMASLQKTNFEKIDKIQYIRVLDSQVVVAESYQR